MVDMGDDGDIPNLLHRSFRFGRVECGKLAKFSGAKVRLFPLLAKHLQLNSIIDKDIQYIIPVTPDRMTFPG